eukprot:165730_1
MAENELHHANILNASKQQLKEPPQTIPIGINVVELYENELRSLSMIEFDDTQYGWHNVTELYLDHNLLTEIPVSLCFGMHLLTHLTLHNNHLQHLPSNIGALNHLRELRIDHNKIRILPDSICDLKHLQLLHIDGNSITCLPRNIGAMSELLDLGIGSCHIDRLPPSFINLNKLMLLWFDQRYFNNIPRQIITASTRDTTQEIVQYLSLLYNQIIPSLDSLLSW